MRTTIAIEESLVEEACQLSGQQKAVVVATQALLEYIQRRKQLKLLELFGTVEYYESVSYKNQRGYK